MSLNLISSTRLRAGLLWLLAGAATTVCAQTSAPVRPGKILEAPPGCEIRRDDAGPWLPLQPSATVVADMRIRCASIGLLRLQLPGNGATADVKFERMDLEYLVPVGRDYRSLASPLGREASLTPEQQRAAVAGMGAMSGAAIGAVLSAAMQSQTRRSLPGPTPVESCPHPIGTLAVADPSPELLGQLDQAGLGSPTGWVVDTIAKTNCFVVDRAAGLSQADAFQIRSRAAEDVAGGSAATAQRRGPTDYVLMPDLVTRSPLRIGQDELRQAASLRPDPWYASLQLADTRSAVVEASVMAAVPRLPQGSGQVAASQPTAGAQKVDSAFVEAYIRAVNLLVHRLRDNAPAVAPATVRTRWRAGDSGVRLYASPFATSPLLVTVEAGEELESIGTPQGAFRRVTSARGEGWALSTQLQAVP